MYAVSLHKIPIAVKTEAVGELSHQGDVMLQTSVGFHLAGTDAIRRRLPACRNKRSQHYRRCILSKTLHGLAAANHFLLGVSSRITIIRFDH
jgi:hypothetical protein